MIFILRLVLILLAFAFVVYVFKAIARISFNLRHTAKELTRLREQGAGRQAATNSTPMVRCTTCGAFVATQDAVQIVSAGRAQNFCSRECLQAHAKTA